MENKMAATVFFPLLFLTRVLGEESATTSSHLNPRNFNHHAFAAKYLQGLKSPETTKQGPVLFPNDAPPPPRPPLIVTSRPLIESLARSELNPAPQNNSVPQQSQINNVIKPFLARVKDYRPFAFVATPEPSYGYGLTGSGRNGYDDYEHQPALPPIYKVFADHAKQAVVKIQKQRNKDRYENKIHGPEYYHHRKTDDENGYDSHNDDEQNKNYAFSYRVKDQKTGDDFSHSQHSSGSATNGEYRVRLPDGRMQIVSYTADENGYQADVRYADDEVVEKKPVKINDYKSENPYKYDPNIFDDNHDNLETNDIDVNDNHNSFHNNRNDYNDRSYYNDYSHNAYTERPEYKNDYVQHRDYKTDDNDKFKTPTSNDYTNQYADLFKEYYNDDLSSEYESKSYDYAPHKSKFSSFTNDKNIKLSKIITPKADFVSGSTVRPTYEELKDLLVTKKAYNTVHPTYFPKIPVTISVPSTTPSSIAFEGTTERVVVIGGKKTNFYTNVRNVPLVSTPYPVSITPSPINYVSHGDYSVSPTPMNYLASTIATLRNQVDFSGPKPVLSNSYIDRINKYLRFN